LLVHPSFPGGSKSRVKRAGERIREGAATEEDIAVVEEWRAAHRGVLNTFQAILRNRTRGSRIIVAQRHKRRMTIYGKLQRFPQMSLVRMDDVAGCRLIFHSIRELSNFRLKFHKAKFNHLLQNDVDKYDYIKNPKDTGYRGIHDIYEYNVKSKTGRNLTGLLIEIQYRTLVQHAWATAVEVIGFITQSQPKFQQGDKRYETEMAYASELLARAHEDLKGPFPGLTDNDVVKEFHKLDRELHLMSTLRGLNSAKSSISDKRNTILIFSKDGNLEIKSYRGATEALKKLFILEKELPEQDIVLVRADTTENVRLAYRNYFKDAREFVRLIDSACSSLGKGKQE